MSNEEKKSESAYKEGEESEDRIKAWQEKAAEVLLIRTDRQADEEDYYVAGCEHVWNTYVVPLQESLRIEREAHDKSMADNKALRDQLEACEQHNKILCEQKVELLKEIDRLKAEVLK